jgi:hypothetical protein
MDRSREAAAAESQSRNARGADRRSGFRHLRLHKPHLEGEALSSLRADLKSLYQELSAALLPDLKEKK